MGCRILLVVPGRNILFLAFAGTYVDNLGASESIPPAYVKPTFGLPRLPQRFCLKLMEPALVSGMMKQSLEIITPLMMAPHQGTNPGAGG